MTLSQASDFVRYLLHGEHSPREAQRSSQTEGYWPVTNVLQKGHTTKAKHIEAPRRRNPKPHGNKQIWKYHPIKSSPGIHLPQIIIPSFVPADPASPSPPATYPRVRNPAPVDVPRVVCAPAEVPLVNVRKQAPPGPWRAGLRPGCYGGSSVAPYRGDAVDKHP